MAFAKGVDVKTVSEILGHSSVTITYNMYIHLIKPSTFHHPKKHPLVSKLPVKAGLALL